MLLIFTSVVAGLFTVVSPCILPVLPGILGGSIGEKNKNSKYFIISSLIVSVFLFTLILKFSSLLVDVPQSFWTNFSGITLILVGLSIIFPNIYSNLIFKFGLRAKVNNSLLSIRDQVSSAWKSLIIGILLGPVFATCSPTYFYILATALPLHLGFGILLLSVFCLSLGAGLLVIVSFGDIIISKLNENMYKKINIFTGSLVVLVGILVFTNIDKFLSVRIENPKALENIEGNLLEKSVKKEVSEITSNGTVEQKNDVTGNKESATPGKPIQKKQLNEKVNLSNTINTIGGKQLAPELSGIVDRIDGKYEVGSAYKNLSQTLSENKVVILYFWTYSCINCIRSLPSLNSLYEKYHDKGLEVVGVHTPEFAFEKNKENVIKNANKLGVKFPIFMDNNYTTWNAWQNSYWPRKYIILPTGEIIFDHSGEGAYEEIDRIVKNIIEK